MRNYPAKPRQLLLAEPHRLIKVIHFDLHEESGAAFFKSRTNLSNLLGLSTSAAPNDCPWPKLILESHPVVVSSASRCVFFQRPSPGGFASVKKPYPVLFDQADETFCRLRSHRVWKSGPSFRSRESCLRTDQGSDGLARLSFGSIVRTFTQDNLTCPKV